jgi:hypothetical protein
MKLATTLILAGFALMVIDGDKPAYRRATFDTFAECVAAGKGRMYALDAKTGKIVWEFFLVRWFFV